MALVTKAVVAILVELSPGAGVKVRELFAPRLAPSPRFTTPVARLMLNGESSDRARVGVAEDAEIGARIAATLGSRVRQGLPPLIWPRDHRQASVVACRAAKRHNCAGRRTNRETRCRCNRHQKQECCR